MTTRTSRGAQPGPSRREQLTAIAATLFARDGYHNVTVGDIAAAAGLSGPAIYRHFPGKQAILAEVVRSGFDEMAGAVAADLAGSPDPAQRLHTVYRDLAAFVIRRPEFGVMWRREYRHLAPADAAELAKRMGEASGTAVAEIRRLRPALPAADAELLAWAALSVLGSISDHRVRPPRAAFEDLLAGIAMDVASTEFGPEETDNRPQEPRREDRKEQILAAAAQLFWDRGYHAVTLEEIGAAAGIAGPSIYSHFAGKTDLLRTITERIGERLRLTLAEEEAVGAAPVDALTAAAAGDPAAAPAPPPGRAPIAGDRATTAPTTPTPTPSAARAALCALAARYVATVLTSRDLVAAYFTEGHNLPDRDRADTRRFQRAYAAHWAALLSAACPERSPEEVRIRVLAAFAVVNDTARTRRLMDRPGLAGRLRAVMLAVLLTPDPGARDVNRR
ncbi:TetR family transcriptional regulator [Catenulispora subtropica]|uniref:TetR/AcrR family transcriptional regulator n=1 Tax=Catenulispora subtropica TaxID=450798 RepID=A0ABN2RXE8_9ACTN